MSVKFRNLLPFFCFKRITERGDEEVCIKLSEEVKGPDGKIYNAMGEMSELVYCDPKLEIWNFVPSYRISRFVSKVINNDRSVKIAARSFNLSLNGWDSDIPRTPWLEEKGIEFARRVFTGTQHSELPMNGSH